MVTDLTFTSQLNVACRTSILTTRTNENLVRVVASELDELVRKDESCDSSDKMLSSFSKVEPADRMKCSRASKETIEGPISSQHSCSSSGPEVEIIGVVGPSVGNREKEKPSFGMQILTCQPTPHLLEEDISMLKSSKANFLCKDAKNLLGQVTALVSMASIKTAEDALEAEKRLCEVADLQKESKLENHVRRAKDENEGNQKIPSQQESKIELLKDDVANSYMVDFGAALEQVVVVYPDTDLSLMDPCKAVVDEKLM
ncbi:hypothetical protein ACSQ67_014639 [Phaseolus vulgaris]